MSLRFEPLIPMSLWLAIAAIALAVLTWYAWTRPGAMSRARWRVSIGMMTVALGAILLLLLNPTWSRPVPPPPGKPVLTVLVDASASMAATDAEAQASRYASAIESAKRIRDAVGGEFDVRLRQFDRASMPLTDISASAAPRGTSTDLAQAITASVAGDSQAGEAIVLLSDGIHNAGGGSTAVLDAVRVARAMNAPIFTRTIGGDAKRTDIALDMRSTQDLAIVGQHVPLSAQVTNAGFAAASVEVHLVLDGKEVAQRTANIAAGESTEVHFSVSHEKSGVFMYEVRASGVEGETSTANNSAAYALRVVAEPVRVLVLEGKPYWDNKFLLRSLIRDPAVAVDSVVLLTPQRMLRRVLTHKQGDDPSTLASRDDAWQISTDPTSFLQDRARLRTYQVIVLGRDAEPFLTEQAVANLQDWVAEDGGSLVCYRGSPTSGDNAPLAKLLPVRWSSAQQADSRFRVNLTDVGQRTDWFGGTDAQNVNYAIQGMPSLVSSAPIASSKPLAIVLASTTSSDGSTAPAIVYQPYGGGRVVVIEGSGMWRWAFLAPKFQQQQEIYTSLWHSMMRWLSSGSKLQPGQQFNLRADKVRFGSTENATATVLARENLGASSVPGVELSLDAPDAPVTRFAPSTAGDEAGVFRVSFGQLPEGRYRARLAGSKEADASAHVIFEVRSLDREQLDFRARPDLMQRIAEMSGGAVLQSSDASEAAKQYIAYRTRTSPPQETTEPAWDKWWVLAGVLGLWALTWFVRRSGGLV